MSTTEEKRGMRKTFTGIVTSDKMDKTVVVEVSRRAKHIKFGKYQTKNARYKAHSENNDVHTGDKVVIVETRPLSKDKCWKVQSVVERARQE